MSITTRPQREAYPSPDPEDKPQDHTGHGADAIQGAVSIEKGKKTAAHQADDVTVNTVKAEEPSNSGSHVTTGLRSAFRVLQEAILDEEDKHAKEIGDLMARLTLEEDTTRTLRVERDQLREQVGVLTEQVRTERAEHRESRRGLRQTFERARQVLENQVNHLNGKIQRIASGKECPVCGRQYYVSDHTRRFTVGNQIIAHINGMNDHAHIAYRRGVQYSSYYQ